MANSKTSGDAMGLLILGGIAAAMGLLTLGIGLFLTLEPPVEVTLTCDRAADQCVRSGKESPVPIVSLTTARQEKRDDEARLVVDHEGKVVALSNFSSDEVRKAAQAAAAARMRAFASSQEPTLAVSYFIGGKPDVRLWLGATVALLFGASYLRSGLRRRAGQER